LLNASRRE